MGNITNMLGVAFTPPVEIKIVKTPEEQLTDAMSQHGITAPDNISLDGKLRRFSSGTKGKGGSGDKTGWYIGFSDGIPSAKFGCWRAGVEVNFRADIGRKLTASEEITNSRRIGEAQFIRDSELAKERERSANTVVQIWTSGGHSVDEHPYLQRKGIGFNGARVTGDGRLMVPLYDVSGNISSIQYIGPDGDKKYHPGGATSSCFWYLGTKSDIIYVVEGFATGATVFEVTDKLTYISYSASNIPNVVNILREKYGPSQDICVIADNDESGIGQKYADQACAKYGCRSIMPPDKGDANDFVSSGGDLLALLQPIVEDWLIPADDFSLKPSPISWLVKDWLQEDALIMIHGPSGGGKTFVVLDLCMSMASNITTWAGNKVKSCDVIYLAGEGHAGLRGRVAAWKQEKCVNKLNMWISKSGLDLNTHDGYMKVSQQLKSLNVNPKLIVVDTLHRFLYGDENSSQDAKSMLDACANLMREFNCSVALVHHTGINEESQHRARGSSAWRGALDIEISIIPAKDDTPMQIVQRKSKDAELTQSLYCELKSVSINNWKDEDGLPVTSAIINFVEAKPLVKKESKLEKKRKQFDNAWAESGRELREGMPYLTRSAFHDYLEKQGNKDSYITNQLKPSYSNGIIFELLNSSIISVFEHGWLLKDAVQSSALLLTI